MTVIFYSGITECNFRTDIHRLKYTCIMGRTNGDDHHGVPQQQVDLGRNRWKQ